MKRIAIITLYDNINIGNKLQNYAVQTILEKIGFACTTIRYKETIKEISWKGHLLALLAFPGRKARIKRMIIKRRKAFKGFSDSWLKTGKAIHFKDAAAKLAGKYDYYLTGSDQVWHNWTDTKEELEYFLLEFAPRHKRICLAPSFGFDQIPDKYMQLYKKGLMGFEYLSCREKSGCRMIEELTGRSSQLLPDPTMALERKDWDLIAEKPAYDLPEKYLLVYILGDIRPEDEEQIGRIAAERGLEIVNIFSLDCEKYFYTNPAEFIYLVRNADYVCTNSFHGCVFSIIYNISFRLFFRTDPEGSRMHSRISTLLDKFDLTGCMTTDAELGELDFTKANEIIKEERKKLTDYLQRALGLIPASLQD